MAKFWINILSGVTLIAFTFAEKCDHTPPQATVMEPTKNLPFYMSVQNNGKDVEDSFLPDQRYVVSLKTMNSNHSFRWFMITAEDPDVDNSNYEFEHRGPAEVGILKTLDKDMQSRYSERCLNTVENMDNSEKTSVKIHWLSPKNTVPDSQRVRLRAMVAQNEEVWHTEPNLSVVLNKDDSHPVDSPPYVATEECAACSEARYEVIFKGQWSRLTHPLHFPDNVANNGFSRMVGASHSYDYILWERGMIAKEGLKLAAENGNTSVMERDIISAVSKSKPNSTRTLIRGKEISHPNMFEPSYALFRADPLHHLFSLVIAIKPSPDWFLGASKFELCDNGEWLKNFMLPLYPFDAGTMDGISYTSPDKMSQPRGTVDRVGLGSFNSESPFYQINLNELKPFGHLHINLLNVYPLEKAECSSQVPHEDKLEEQNEEETEEPEVAESRHLPHGSSCGFGSWREWSRCQPYDGECGAGAQFRTRLRMFRKPHNGLQNHWASKESEDNCIEDPDKMDTQFTDCYVDCY